MFKSLAIFLAVALVASANQDYKSNRMKLLTQTVSARLHGEALPSDQPQFKAVARTKNLQASIPQGSQLQFQSQPQFVSQQFGTQMPMSQLSQQQQFVPQFQAPQQPQQQRAPSAMEQAQLQQQLQKQQQIQQQQQQINAQKAVQDQQVLQQQQQLIQQQQQQQHIAQPQQQVVSQQMPQQQPQFIVSPDASSISGAQAPISPLQQQQLMQQQQQQQMINSQQQSQIPQLQQQQNAQLQQQIQQQQRVPQPIAPISQQFTAPVPQQVQQFTAPQQQVQQFTAPAPQQVQQFAPQQQFVAQQAPQFVQQQQPTFQQQQQFPVSSSGLAQTCSTAQPGDLIAHPASPSSFIICYGFGEFTVMECPEHLVFNAHTQRCDLTTDVPMGCASNPCLNNGQCADVAPGIFQCKCPIGFNGPHCERVDACSTNTCGGDGVCIALPAGSPVPNACMCNGGRSIGVNCASAEANPCIQPNSNLRLFSVNFNPSLFAHCEGARPNFMFCQAPLIFNAAKQSCDWPSRK